MLISEIMQRPVIKIAFDATVKEAVVKMHHHNIGFLPVVKDGWVTGVITDRDILCRCLVDHQLDLSSTVMHIMTRKIYQCSPQQSVKDAAAMMGDFQIRRLPVCDPLGSLVGVLSVGDIAEHCSELLAGEALGEIVEFR